MCAQVGDQMRKMPGSTGVNPYAQLIEDAEGLDKIEQLQDHPNEDLYEKVGGLLEVYSPVIIFNAYKHVRLGCRTTPNEELYEKMGGCLSLKSQKFAVFFWLCFRTNSPVSASPLWSGNAA